MGYTKIACSALSAVFLFACAQPSIDLEAERAALQQADADYLDAVEVEDIERWISWYAVDATLYPPNGSPVVGTDAIREFGVQLTEMPDFSASFDPMEIEVSADGDMGYTRNHYVVTITGPDGNPVTEEGPDFHVWRKQADGSWKVVVDIWNSDLPLPVTEDTSEADREAISELHDREVEALFAGDLEAVTAVFAEDAVAMPPNEPIVQGTEAVETWSRNLFDQVSIQGNVEVIDLALAGDWAIERYEYDFEVSPAAGGDAVQDEGKGLHVYRRQPDGTWKIAVDIWNANGPPPSSQ